MKFIVSIVFQYENRVIVLIIDVIRYQQPVLHLLFVFISFKDNTVQYFSLVFFHFALNFRRHFVRFSCFIDDYIFYGVHYNITMIKRAASIIFRFIVRRKPGRYNYKFTSDKSVHSENGTGCEGRRQRPKLSVITKNKMSDRDKRAIDTRRGVFRNTDRAFYV